MKRVLMISTDRKSFEVGSAVRRRLVEYGELTVGLEVVVFSLAKNGFREVKISDRVYLYPTNTKTKIGHLIKAYFLGRKLTRPDIVTCQDPFETGLVGCLLARFWKARLEVQIHTDFLAPEFSHESWLNYLRVKLARFILPQADQIRVVSLRVKNSLNKTGLVLKTDPVILPIFIEDEDKAASGVDLHAAYPQFKKIVLMTARLTKEKRLDLALKSFASALNSYPDMGLVVAGSGPLLNQLKILAKTLKIEQQVIFTGWVNTLSHLYRSADCFLSTSTYEGYGLSLVEASLAGLPIVSTDVGVAKEVGAEIVSADIGAVASAIVLAINKGKVVPPDGLPVVKKTEYLRRLGELWQ